MTVRELKELLMDYDINLNIYTAGSVDEEVDSVDVWTDEYFDNMRQGDK